MNIFCYLDLARKLWAKYIVRMCKVLYFVVFLRQVATGHFVGKNICMPNNKLYFSYVLQNFHKKVYISDVIIFKNEKVFLKMIFLKQVKKYS
jgi:hypothetical protein